MQKKLVPRDLPVLKKFDLLALCLWTGGTVSLGPTLFKMNLTDYRPTLADYQHLGNLASGMMQWGAMASVVTSILIVIFLRERFLKLLFTLGGVAFGIFFMEVKIFGNIAILESLYKHALKNEVFLTIHSHLKYAFAAQAVLLGILVFLTLTKRSEESSFPSQAL